MGKLGLSCKRDKTGEEICHCDKHSFKPTHTIRYNLTLQLSLYRQMRNRPLRDILATQRGGEERQGKGGGDKGCALCLQADGFLSLKEELGRKDTKGGPTTSSAFFSAVWLFYSPQDFCENAAE